MSAAASVLPERIRANKVSEKKLNKGDGYEQKPCGSFFFEAYLAIAHAPEYLMDTTLGIVCTAAPVTAITTGIGVSFAAAARLGTFITTAIAFHNVPEGLAIR
ncbi:MAG: hypothetical protein ACI9KS_000454 [Sulfitobacter sp.]